MPTNSGSATTDTQRREETDAEIITLLSAILDKLEAILNHQREITDIESGKGMNY